MPVVETASRGGIFQLRREFLAHQIPEHLLRLRRRFDAEFLAQHAS
jgi:hypothetical protein